MESHRHGGPFAETKELIAGTRSSSEVEGRGDRVDEALLGLMGEGESEIRCARGGGLRSAAALEYAGGDDQTHGGRRRPGS